MATAFYCNGAAFGKAHRAIRWMHVVIIVLVLHIDQGLGSNAAANITKDTTNDTAATTLLQGIVLSGNTTTLRAAAGAAVLVSDVVVCCGASIVVNASVVAGPSSQQSSGWLEATRVEFRNVTFMAGTVLVVVGDVSAPPKGAHPSPPAAPFSFLGEDLVFDDAVLVLRDLGLAVARNVSVVFRRLQATRTAATSAIAAVQPAWLLPVDDAVLRSAVVVSNVVPSLLRFEDSAITCASGFIVFNPRSPPPACCVGLLFTSPLTISNGSGVEIVMSHVRASSDSSAVAPIAIYHQSDVVVSNLSAYRILNSDITAEASGSAATAQSFSGGTLLVSQCSELSWVDTNVTTIGYSATAQLFYGPNDGRVVFAVEGRSAVLWVNCTVTVKSSTGGAIGQFISAPVFLTSPVGVLLSDGSAVLWQSCTVTVSSGARGAAAQSFSFVYNGAPPSQIAAAVVLFDGSSVAMVNCSVAVAGFSAGAMAITVTSHYAGPAPAALYLSGRSTVVWDGSIVTVRAFGSAQLATGLSLVAVLAATTTVSWLVGLHANSQLVWRNCGVTVVSASHAIGLLLQKQNSGTIVQGLVLDNSTWAVVDTAVDVSAQNGDYAACVTFYDAGETLLLNVARWIFSNYSCHFRLQNAPANEFLREFSSTFRAVAPYSVTMACSTLNGATVTSARVGAFFGGLMAGWNVTFLPCDSPIGLLLLMLMPHPTVFFCSERVTTLLAPVSRTLRPTSSSTHHTETETQSRSMSHQSSVFTASAAVSRADGVSTDKITGSSSRDTVRTIASTTSTVQRPAEDWPPGAVAAGLATAGGTAVVAGAWVAAATTSAATVSSGFSAALFVPTAATQAARSGLLASLEQCANNLAGGSNGNGGGLEPDTFTYVYSPTRRHTDGADAAAMAAHAAGVLATTATILALCCVACSTSVVGVFTGMRGA